MALKIACQASVSMQFWSTEQETRVKERAKNGPSPPSPPLSFLGSRSISRTAKTENPIPQSFFAPKPHGNLKKWIRAALYRAYSISFTSTIILFVRLYQSLKFRKRKRKSLSWACVHVLPKTRNLAVSRLTCFDGKEIYKKRDARAKFLLCQSDPIAFCRHRRRLCLSSLLFQLNRHATWFYL